MSTPSVPQAPFHLFPSLPTEIRLMIWEFTWTKERIIEVYNIKTSKFEEVSDDGEVSDDEDEFNDPLGFRPTCLLSTWLQQVYLDRIIEQKPIEKLGDPVALKVCTESRYHALKTHILIENPASAKYNFYLNPHLDILALYFDVMDIDFRYQSELQNICCGQLSKFRRGLLTASNFEDLGNGTEDVFITFPKLRRLLVVLEEYGHGYEYGYGYSWPQKRDVNAKPLTLEQRYARGEELMNTKTSLRERYWIDLIGRDGTVYIQSQPRQLETDDIK